MCKCKGDCISHECIQLKAKHVKAFILEIKQQFQCHVHNLLRHTTRCPKKQQCRLYLKKKNTGNEGNIRFWKCTILVIASYRGVYLFIQKRLPIHYILNQNQSTVKKVSLNFVFWCDINDNIDDVHNKHIQLSFQFRIYIIF